MAPRSKARTVAQAGLIAAVYGSASLLTMQFLGPLAFGPIQFRVSEAFTVVALFTPAAIPGLWLGTVIANASLAAASPLAWLDVVFGGIGTLLAAIWTWRFRRRKALALAGPVIFNALIVAAYLPILLQGLGGTALLDMYRVPVVGWDLTGSWLAMYAFGVVAVGIGQAVVVYGLGWPLASAIVRSGVTREE
jgi:uncharacterized membrane protein